MEQVKAGVQLQHVMFYYVLINLPEIYEPYYMYHLIG